MRTLPRSPFLFVVILSCAVEYSRSQDYPFLHRIEIQTVVSKEPSNAMYFYSYVLFNDSSSRGAIQEFEIDISRSAGSQMLDTTGLRFAGSGLMERWFRRDFPPRQGNIVPVGMPSVPNKKWTAILANNPTVSFFARSLFIDPGSSVEGIVIMSRGIPGIRAFVARPNFQEDILFPSIEDTSANAMTIAQMDSIREAVNFRGWTIGPIAPPMHFDPLAWCDTLISYKHQAFALGWIKEEGIVTSLDAKLEAARPQIIADRPSAKNILQSFVNELDALNTQGNQITSEAYALLKFNAEYLISKL